VLPVRRPRLLRCRAGAVPGKHLPGLPNSCIASPSAPRRARTAAKIRCSRSSSGRR